MAGSVPAMSPSVKLSQLDAAADAELELLSTLDPALRAEVLSLRRVNGSRLLHVECHILRHDNGAQRRGDVSVCCGRRLNCRVPPVGMLQGPVLESCEEGAHDRHVHEIDIAHPEFLSSEIIRGHEEEVKVTFLLKPRVFEVLQQHFLRVLHRHPPQRNHRLGVNQLSCRFFRRFAACFSFNPLRHGRVRGSRRPGPCPLRRLLRI
mmetsp:Transcript_33404/g.92274  ORF Transcript_33404/g.92274 Transcript_33404/m.92274 type:complete len:206 (+) Transcript_33404:213-830(+)